MQKHEGIDGEEVEGPAGEERSIGGLNLTGVKRIDRAASFDCNPVSAEQRGTPGDSYFKGETNRVPGTTTAIKSAVTTGASLSTISIP